MAKKDFDFELVKELNLVADNEKSIYDKEGWLAKNYARKSKRGVFDFGKAQKGVKNLIVTPFARDYQKQWGAKVPAKERDAVAKARLRAILRRMKEGEY
jgi:5'(3')-deoxyribonucleotidase